MSDVQRALVVAPNWLGDAVMALPAIADVRRQAQHLTIAARPAVANLFRMVPGVDELITLRWRGSLLRRRDFDADVTALHRAAAGVAILLPNSFASAWLTKRAAVPERWGYRRDVRSVLLTRGIATPRGSMHQGAYYQHLTSMLGVPAGPLEPAVVVPAAAVDSARGLLTAAGWNGTSAVVALAAGAAYGTAKRWLPSHFADLVRRLVRERGDFCVMVGSAGDAETTRWVRGLLPLDVGAAVADLAGATSLEQLAGVLQLASACVSNDSGAMHLAAAIGVPVAALFGPTRDHETAPLPARGGRTSVLINPVWCRPCMLRECPIDHRCMKGLAPARVATAIAELTA